MEPRARAGKNVGKMTFGHNELTQLLYGHGDVKPTWCLPETVRVLDEIATEFIQGVSFEATRTAHHAGRQKVKFEDFEFAMRKNPVFMGKIRETFEKKREIDRARHIMNEDESIIKEANKAEKKAAKAAAKAAAKEAAANGPGGGGGRGGGKRDEEELGEEDDDAQAEADALGTPSGNKRRRLE
ncbi:transcription initiation factor IID [Coniochaeta sp. 2T2.1]|nr:transcription initiation factor IID [Coniochaeta sp. 2T2.1]